MTASTASWTDPVKLYTAAAGPPGPAAFFLQLATNISPAAALRFEAIAYIIDNVFVRRNPGRDSVAEEEPDIAAA